jgi:hypothetical protein
VDRLWRRRGGRRDPSNRGDLPHSTAATEATGEDRCSERFEIGLTGQPGIEGFEPFGRIQQQRRNVAAASTSERDLGAQPRQPGALKLVQRAQLRRRQKVVRHVKRGCLELGLRSS